MTEKLKSRQGLLNEIKALRSRLEEAEETLRAIRDGEVDGFVVAQSDKMHTLMLKGADYPYHILIDSMGEGALTLIPDGTIFFCNSRFAEIVQSSFEKLIGSPFQSLIPPEERSKFGDMVKASRQNTVRGEYRLQTVQGTYVPVQLSAHILETEDVEAITIVVTDLTDRQLAEQARWEAEHKLNKMLQSIVDGTLVVDLSGRITFANPAAERILEIQKDRIIGSNYYSGEWQQIDLNRKPYSLDQHPLTIALRDQRETNAVEHGVITPSGEIKWLSVNASPLLDEKGQLYGAVASFRDVTGQKQSAEALDEMHRRIAFQASLLDQVRNAVIAIGLDGKIFYWNKFAEHLYGWQAQEVIGKPVQEVIVPKEDIGIAEEILKSVRQIGYWEGEFHVSRRDGSIFPAHVVDTLISDAQGRAIGYVGVSIDITERKQAEATLRNSETRYRRLFEAAQDGVLLVNSDTGEIFDANPYLVKFLGYSYEELLGRKLWEIGAFGDVATSQLAFSELQKNNYVRYDDLPLRSKDGHLKEVEFISNIYMADQKRVIQCNVRDISERKRAEEEIRSRTQELEVLYRLSRALASANDLNQVLDIANREAVEIVHITFSRIALLEGNELIVRAGFPMRDLDHDLLIGERKLIADLPYCRRVLEGNEPVILYAGDPEVGQAERTALLLEHIHSLCLMPLLVGTTGADSSVHLLGMLMLGEARDEHREPITPQKLHLIRSIGDQAASAIRRMLLREETDRRLQHLLALNEVDSAITSGFDLKNSLATVLEQGIQQLDADAADILLLNSNTQTLEFFSGLGFRTKPIENLKLKLGESYAGRAAQDRDLVYVPNLQNSSNVPISPGLAVENFVGYYAAPLITKGQVKGILEIFNRTPFMPDEEFLRFLKSLAEQAAIAIDNALLFDGLTHSNNELSLAYNETIEGWSRALDLRDKETEGHTLRVTNNGLILAGSFGLNQDELEKFRWGALLHDIGKMGVPDGILLKPGPLTDEEWVLMRMHPALAYEMLSPIHYLRQAVDIPYCHHEKWDGTGYPRGLKGEQIPMAARIFAIVDVWDALTNDRPYRPAWSGEKALAYIEQQSGKHFDPQVLKAFRKSFDRLFGASTIRAA